MRAVSVPWTIVRPATPPVPLAPTVWLAVLLLIGNAGWAIASAFSLPLPPAFMTLYFVVGLPWVLAWWVVADSRHRKVATPIDQGWFVFFAWPVALPYYLIRTRGPRGCLVLAGLIGLFVASCILAIGLFYALARARG